MAHKNPLRKDKTCLNCNYVVDNRFCPNCGQENIEPRKTFHHLFLHFFEDLTHYENAFWKTIKNLILHPAALTKEYLSGKRMSYLAPVRLYIFISFVTFFVITIFGADKVIDEKKDESKNESKSESLSSKKETEALYAEQKKIIELEKQGIISKKDSDSIQKMITESKENKESKNNHFLAFGNESSIKELDSIKKASPNKIGDIEYWFKKKALEKNGKYSKKELMEQLGESFMHNLPKLVIIYMPFFAFFLWLFHNKKKWFYFDHGIFTLHYFSFLLLSILFLFLSKKLLLVFGNNSVLKFIRQIITFGGIIWMLYYFFPAHHRFYGGKRRTSVVLGSFLFIINSIIILFFLAAGFVYSFITLH